MDNNTMMPKAKLGKNGWEVQCATPLAEAIARMAGRTVTQIGDGVGTVPYTQQLDRSLVNLVDALINLRRDAGRVQLTLADAQGGREL